MKRITSLIMMLCAFCLSNAANYLTFTAEEAGAKFGIYNSEDNEPDVQYSIDNGQTWTVLKPGDRVELKNVGDNALLKGYNPDGFSMSFAHNGEYFYDYTEFRMSGKIAASGSVMSLVDGEGTSVIIPSNGCFYRLFSGCTSLTEAPELPATTLRNQCYQQMFYNCTSLKQAPELPATKLFPGCYMFMFYFCENLEKAPYLPATNFFKDYSGHSEDFIGCYTSMFGKCRSLKEIEVNIPDWGEIYEVREGVFDSNTSGWVADVASTGTFICPKALAKEYGVDRIPEGWTIKYIDENTGVNDVEASGLAVWTDGNTIYVRGAEGEISLYDVYGRLVSTSAIKADDIQMFSVPAKGVYLVGTKGETVTTLVR